MMHSTLALKLLLLAAIELGARLSSNLRNECMNEPHVPQDLYNV